MVEELDCHREGVGEEAHHRHLEVHQDREVGVEEVDFHQDLVVHFLGALEAHFLEGLEAHFLDHLEVHCLKVLVDHCLYWVLEAQPLHM